METYGKQEDGPFKVSNSPGDVVERLITPISGTYRNVTCNNWFMSIPLAQNLFIKHILTVTGVLRKNKRELPPIFLRAKNRPIESSIFGFGEVGTLVSYTPKKK